VSLPVRFHPLAAGDVVEAWSWYEARQSGLGDRFVAAVRESLDLAARWPDSGAPTVGDDQGEVIERRLTTSGFPYALRYRIIDEMIVVMAVYHQRRHPNFGASRGI
jgi:plasmid stabilization system protein ParE